MQIKRFYADKGLHIEKLIRNRDPGITPIQIKLAAIKVYREIQNGMEFKNDAKIGQRVHVVAKTIDIKRFKKIIKVLKGDVIEINLKIKGIK